MGKKNLGWKISSTFWIPVEDLRWKSRIRKNNFRIWGRFPDIGKSIYPKSGNFREC